MSARAVGRYRAECTRPRDQYDKLGNCQRVLREDVVLAAAHKQPDDRLAVVRLDPRVNSTKAELAQSKEFFSKRFD